MCVCMYTRWIMHSNCNRPLHTSETIKSKHVFLIPAVFSMYVLEKKLQKYLLWVKSSKNPHLWLQRTVSKETLYCSSYTSTSNLTPPLKVPKALTSTSSLPFQITADGNWKQLKNGFELEPFPSLWVTYVLLRRLVVGYFHRFTYLSANCYM